MDLRTVNCNPRLATSAERARSLGALHGAAVVAGIASLADAVAFGERMLGLRTIRVRPQFEATKEHHDHETAAFAALGADDRGRERDQGGIDDMQPAHYDGFGFGDFAPDHMFLWCQRPCDQGGASFLVDGLALVNLLGADDPELARALWEVDVDHSEPHFPGGAVSPIARLLPGGRVQVRAHPSQTALAGPDQAASGAVLERWAEAIARARVTGPRFRVVPGEMICTTTTGCSTAATGTSTRPASCTRSGRGRPRPSPSPTVSSTSPALPSRCRSPADPAICGAHRNRRIRAGRPGRVHDAPSPNVSSGTRRRAARSAR
ncbi:MAG: TauD/TfdA family dioxygenase [Ilumatobacteraceae bacterium]